MGIKGLDHVNISTSNMNDTLSFYVDLLNFTDGYRPPFDFPGAWLYAGENPVIHLVFSDSDPKVICNPVDHIAFEATDFEKTKQRLENANWEFRCSSVPDTQIRQIFLVDPNGVKLELNFKF